jgi:hypothetical protein
VVAVNDDDLITNDEVHVPAPLGVDLDERRGNRHHPHAGWHCGAGAEGEVDVIDPRHIAPGQDRPSDLRALLRTATTLTAWLMKLSGYIAARLSIGQVIADNSAIMDCPLNEGHWAYLSDWKKRCNGPDTIPALLESLLVPEK